MILGGFGLVAGVSQLAPVLTGHRSEPQSAINPSGELIIQGKATVVDGDSLEIGSARIRLFGIDAPEGRQQCRDRGGRPYPCGRDATQFLKRLIGAASVRCLQRDVDPYGRSVSDCEVAGRSINQQMVLAGHAVAYTRFTQKYLSDEKSAAQAGVGVWQGHFETPSQWRRNQR